MALAIKGVPWAEQELASGRLEAQQAKLWAGENI